MYLTINSELLQNKAKQDHEQQRFCSLVSEKQHGCCVVTKARAQIIESQTHRSPFLGVRGFIIKRCVSWTLRQRQFPNGLTKTVPAAHLCKEW